MSYEEYWRVNRVMPEPDEESLDAALERAEFALKTRTPTVQDQFQELLERYWTALEGEA